MRVRQYIVIKELSKSTTSVTTIKGLLRSFQKLCLDYLSRYNVVASARNPARALFWARVILST